VLLYCFLRLHGRPRAHTSRTASPFTVTESLESALTSSPSYTWLILTRWYSSSSQSKSGPQVFIIGPSQRRARGAARVLRDFDSKADVKL
jgi:hypothetical protein